MGRGRKRKNLDYVPPPWIHGTDSEEEEDPEGVIHDPVETVEIEDEPLEIPSVPGPSVPRLHDEPGHEPGRLLLYYVCVPLNANSIYIYYL